MNEYIAESGGRYTYADDILNLQELALSMTSIFSACSNFIISGCEVYQDKITPGYIWLNGKVRKFEGCNNPAFPYFIYEINSNDSVTYANDVNKRGRCNYLCTGDICVPTTTDPLTGQVPQFIEITIDYAPRFIDKFIGKYALLLDSPFSKQTIKKELILAGNLTGEKDIESKTAISVVNQETGYSIKNIVKVTGEASIGVYLKGLLVNEIVINTNGSFSFFKQGIEIAKIDSNGLFFTNSASQKAQIGAIMIEANNIFNWDANNDTGSVNVNGYKSEITNYRDFKVYNGKQTALPILHIAGKSNTAYVNGILSINGSSIDFRNNIYSKTAKELIASISWKDKDGEIIGFLGYSTDDSFNFEVNNLLGNIILSTKGYIDILDELRIKGVNIADIYVNKKELTKELDKKVSFVAGKQLSTEDFTTSHKKKLDSISKGNIAVPSEGYITTKEVVDALSMKLSASLNLSDLINKEVARENLGIYSKSEINKTFLKISNNLIELVNLTAEEINGLTSEQAANLKLQKQAAIRDNINAEEKGTGNEKLAKTANLSDISDKIIARKNIGVYSKSEIDNLLNGYLPAEAAYNGVIFTDSLKNKLEAITTGNFAGQDKDGNIIAQKEGYVLITSIIPELGKKANLLLDGYSEDQRKAIASNLNMYLKTEADSKFASVDSTFQDYITHLVKNGKTTAEAQKILRDKLNTPSKEDVVDNYLRKDGKLTDLILPNIEAKKLACRTIGAAYADEYQTKLKDTGWLQMNNSGGSTDTRRLFVRQIGNVVCIQGVINTSKRDGGHWGGTVAIIPNQIDVPKYGLRTTSTEFHDNHKHNRGVTFVIDGNTRNIKLYESGFYNQDTQINFTYMT